MDKPNCLKCKHYQSTYEPTRPRGCRVYGFKSIMMPSMLVKNESGEECKAFELRDHLQKEENKFDFNRKDYW
ncbi:MAG: hypothetical protein COW01_07550 [Bdellovibrionales bacterium CG12_big_fil_rev_8_21_14_0_65_38_15]|nr:MAG: hypothetical protein COW79_01510 [Bdellovibrionales bacterium CG22_combo_CG10-13_8_21_14_all_38_13]PIQ55224.1 MAG: hypothetical protein COW01_07550 [Bdellovibrionales bacterium CG12_big_fil_rev_8_21_14_0_65_38_15]PIR30528.1 MAG: hypothetical protein COV38_05100 [Bdellovibrionales bacterium CG11_big_fil_rev_8_21_14_0_20_38_13]